VRRPSYARCRELPEKPVRCTLVSHAEHVRPPRPGTTAMTESDERSDEARQTFEYFSNEYAQALHAFKAIEDQSTTLMLLGVADDLRGFVDQFIEMATRTKQLAEEKNEPHFAEWFGELIERAEALRGAIPKR